jgi:hypothetical protein
MRKTLTLVAETSGLHVGIDDWVVMHLLENSFENHMAEMA